MSMFDIAADVLDSQHNPDWQNPRPGETVAAAETRVARVVAAREALAGHIRHPVTPADRLMAEARERALRALGSPSESRVADGLDEWLAVNHERSRIARFSEHMALAQSAPGEPIPEDKEPPEPTHPAEKPKENP